MLSAKALRAAAEGVTEWMENSEVSCMRNWYYEDPLSYLGPYCVPFDKNNATYG